MRVQLALQINQLKILQATSRQAHSGITGGQTDASLVKLARHLNVGRRPHELDALEGASWHHTSSMTRLGAVTAFPSIKALSGQEKRLRDDAGLNVANFTAGNRRSPKTKIYHPHEQKKRTRRRFDRHTVDAVHKGRLTLRIGALSRAVAHVVTRLRPTA
jgi:hypothetical protein